MNVQPNRDEPPKEVAEEIASVVSSLDNFARYLDSRLGPTLGRFISCPDSQDISSETKLQVLVKWEEFCSARNQISWTATVMARIHAKMCEQALIRRGLFEREFGGDR